VEPSYTLSYDQAIHAPGVSPIRRVYLSIAFGFRSRSSEASTRKRGAKLPGETGCYGFCDPAAS
ncbi:MAG: hypothetical protein VX904_01910, partial [Planctomycetota bacterium]|nr:hypothetical protein [Planctomycetota bacterium]